MKKLLTILILLLAVALKGYAEDYVNIHLGAFDTQDANCATYGLPFISTSTDKGVYFDWPWNDDKYIVIETAEEAQLKIVLDYRKEGIAQTVHSDESAVKVHKIELASEAHTDENNKGLKKLSIYNLEANQTIHITRVYYQDDNSTATTTFTLDKLKAEDGVTYGETSQLITTTAEDYKGIQYWIGDGSTISGHRLVIKTSEAAKIKVDVDYTGNDAPTSTSKTFETARKEFFIPITSGRNIKAIRIRDTENSHTIVFTEISIDNSDDLSSSFTGEATKSYTISENVSANRFYALFSESIFARIKVTYSDDSVTEYWGTAIERNLILDSTKNISKIEIISTANFTLSESYLDSHSGTEEAFYKLAENENELTTTGSREMGTIADWSDNCALEESQFTNAKAGDILTIYATTEDGAKVYLQVPGIDYQKINSEEGLTNNKFTYTLTQYTAALLRDMRVLVKGEKYTPYHITLTSVEGDAFAPLSTISLDNVEAMGSATYDKSSHAMTTSEVSKGVHFYIGSSSNVTVGNNQDLVLSSSNDMNNLTMKVTYVKENEEESEATSEATLSTASKELKIDLTAGKKIKRIEIRSSTVLSEAITFSDLRINSESTATDLNIETSDNSTSLPFALGVTSGENTDWSKYVKVSKEQFASVKTGDVITVGVTNVSSGAQISLKDMSDGWPALEESTQYPGVETTATSYTYTVTATTAAKLKATGLVVSGHDLTINSLTLTPSETDVTQYSLTINSAGNGSITAYPASSDGKYDSGAQVTLTATPTSGYEFSKWSDGTNDLTAESDGSLKVTMNENKSVTATFVEAAPITYPITVWEGSEAVSWSNPQNQPSISADKFANLALNDVIKVYVTNAENATINIKANDGWVTLSETDSYQVTTDEILTKIKSQGIALTGVNYTLTAVKIEKPKYQLTIVSDGGSVTVKKGEETETTADREFEAGTALTLTATPASSIYTFSKWQKNETDIVGGTNSTLSTTMDGADMTITAVFTTSAEPQDLGAASTEIKAKTDTQNEQGIVIPCWRFKNASVGDIITINMTVTEDGTITLKQSDNGWGDLDNSAATGKALAVGTTSFTYALTETSLPLVKANGLYVMGDKFTCTSVTLISAGTVPTSDTRTEKYIYNESKTITTEATATIAKEIFTNASIGDKLTLTVSSVDNATITLKSGVEAIKSESGVSATSYSYTLQSSDITKVKANGLTIAGSGFTLDKVHLLTEGEVTEVSDPVPDFSLDNFKADEGNTYDKTNHILTNTNGWSGMTLSIGDGSTYSGSFLEVRTKEVSKLKILVKYVGGGEKELSESGDPGRRHVVSEIDNTKKIDQVIIQNQESGTLHFTYMALDPATQYELSVTAEDGSVTVKKNDAVTEETFFDANTVLSLEPVAATNFELEKWTIGGSTSTDNPLSLTMNEDKVVVAHFKPKGLAENETRNLHTSSGDVIDWNQICEKGASYGALLQAGDVFQITVSALTSGTDNHQVVLRGGSHDEGTSVKATGMVEIVMTADILSNYTSGFSITGTGVTISKVDLFRPKAVSRTERMMNESEVVMDGSNGATVNSGRFANASAYDVLRVYFTNTSGATSTSADEDKMHLILKYNGESDNWDYIKEMRFAGSETQFEIPLTQSVLALLKKNGLQITGSGYTFKSVTIKTAGEVPSDGEDDISNDASEEAKKVYNVLKDLYGKKIVSGVVANVDWNTKEAENVYGWTGKYPAMNVYDYINLHASKDVNSAGWVDYSDITTAKNWWKEGGIVGAMWHWQVKANNGTDYTCTPGTAAGETSFDASKVYVDGTSENTLAKQQLDQLCGYLKKMQDAGIPVVWRPLHEASGNVEQYSGGKAWFWWGAKGADVYKQLWQWMYNYMVKTKGLNNLIWVWTSQTKDNNWYPGDAYVDIIGRDNYGATAATLATEYEALKAAHPNKMITLSECGNSESTEMAKLSSIWDAGSRWSWFMTWYDGDYNKGASTTHKHAGETWWKDAVSKDYVITRDKMKELLGQESSDDSKTGVNISLDDLNEGWSSSYNATTKTITTEGEWAARGWYIGDNRYNSKGSVTVKFEAVNFGVTLKMEYTNTGGESKSVSAGAAAGETGVELDIPADIKTMDKVYITYQPIGTLKLTAATVNDKVVDNRTERTLVEKSQAISDGDIAINRGLFSNAVAGDVLRIYADGLSESSKLALEPGDYSGAFDGANWTGFTESPFKLKLTATLIATIKEKGLLIRGESFTFKKAVLYTEKELGSEISDEEKKGDEEKDDEEAIIDEKTGEADLTVLSAQDDTKTTLTENEDGSITMTTTEPYCAAQIWFNDPEPVAGNVLKVELAESKVNVTITVQYTDGTQSQMSANTSGVATARAATRGDSDPGTTIEVPLETGKEVQNIEVKNNVAGTITIKKMQVTTINIFTNGVANLSMLKPQSNATYDTSTHTLATTKGWTGATISPVGGENVSGKELLIEFADASKVKVAVKYRTDVEGPSTIMEKAAKAVRLALDNTKNIQEISIQPTEASIVTFKKIAVNSEESDDGTLKPGKTITLWESAAGETLSWNEVAKQDASVGEILQEYDELLITISGVTEGCDWPKVFIRDASSEQAGNEVLLNDVGSFPYTVRIVLTGEMAQQLQKGFSICGDGVTVTKLQVYRPEAPKTGDIHLSDLNYGYNSSYDKGTHTITTTARWAARGWEIGDKRYNDKNLITVKFEPVDFPVTLKMEYTTGLQTAQATSVGVPAGRTELLLEIPSGISKLDRVYIIYENPGSVKLTEASVTYQDKLKLSTAIEAFEAEGVIHDGRYDTDGWYNLRGMRIAEPKTSGIYIHGGKKVVIY